MKKIGARCCADDDGQRCISPDDPALFMKLTVLNGGPVEQCASGEALRGSELTCSELRFERAASKVANVFNEEVCFKPQKILTESAPSR